VVGFILGGIALFLIRENLRYLIEKASPDELKRDVRKVLESIPIVEDIKDIRMIVLTPDSHRVRAEVEINGYLLVKEMEDSLREDFKEIHNFGDFLQFCAAFANRVTRTIGAKIDEMEEKLKNETKYAKHVDIKPS
jgi:zinc transporter 9